MQSGEESWNKNFNGILKCFRIIIEETCSYHFFLFSRKCKRSTCKYYAKQEIQTKYKHLSRNISEIHCCQNIVSFQSLVNSDCSHLFSLWMVSNLRILIYRPWRNKLACKFSTPYSLSRCRVKESANP